MKIRYILKRNTCIEKPATGKLIYNYQERNFIVKAEVYNVFFPSNPL